MAENDAGKWTEEKLQALSSDEHDFQEYKSTQYLVNAKGEMAGDFSVNLSKQVSAFANAGGGKIFLGIQDDGTPDEGIPMDLKKGGTRSWLEDIIPDLVIPTLDSFNVFEIPARLQGSPIAKGHAVYLIHIEHTPTPPYQAKDQRYYTRIAGKSKPMPHIHVADAFRRVRSPVMALARFSPYGAPEINNSDPRGARVLMAFRVHFVNTSRIMAKQVGAEVTLPRILVGKEVRTRIELSQKTSRTQRPDKISFFHYFPHPVFPSQELFCMMIWIGVHRSNVLAIRSGVRLKWSVYADDADVVTGEVTLNQYAAVQRVLDMDLWD